MFRFFWGLSSFCVFSSSNLFLLYSEEKLFRGGTAILTTHRIIWLQEIYSDGVAPAPASVALPVSITIFLSRIRNIEYRVRAFVLLHFYLLIHSVLCASLLFQSGFLGMMSSPKIVVYLAPIPVQTAPPASDSVPLSKSAPSLYPSSLYPPSAAAGAAALALSGSTGFTRPPSAAAIAALTAGASGTPSIPALPPPPPPPTLQQVAFGFLVSARALSSTFVFPRSFRLALLALLV